MSVQMNWPADVRQGSGADRRLHLMAEAEYNSSYDHGNEVETQGFRPYLQHGNGRREGALVALVIHGVKSPVGGMVSTYMSPSEARQAAEMLILSANEAEQTEAPS